VKIGKFRIAKQHMSSVLLLKNTRRATVGVVTTIKVDTQ
jgi:hypothetical protein